MRNSIKNLRKINNLRKSRDFSSKKKINNRKSKNNSQQIVRRSRNRKIRGGEPNLIHILYVLSNKNQTNQVQVIAISKSVKNLHMIAKDLPDNLRFPDSGKQGYINVFQNFLEHNMVIDTIELNNLSSTHSWQKVSFPDVNRLIENGSYGSSIDNFDETLLHYTLDKSSKITGVIGAVYSNEVDESDGQMTTDFGNFNDVIELLDNYEPTDKEFEIFIKENKLTIEKSDRVLIDTKKEEEQKKKEERQAYLDQLPKRLRQCSGSDCDRAIFELVHKQGIPWKDILDSPITAYDMKSYGFKPYNISLLLKNNSDGLKVIDFLKKGFNLSELNQEIPYSVAYRKIDKYDFSPKIVNDAIINSNLSVREIMNKINYSVYNYAMPLSYLFDNGATQDEVFKYSGYDYSIVLFYEKLSFDEYVNTMEKLCKKTFKSWKLEWHKSIINAGIFQVYDLNDILKKCNELNLWSLFERLLESIDIKIIIENQLDIEKKPLIYFIDILRSYKLYDEIKSLLYREPFMLNQLKSGNVSLKEIINDYVYLKDKSLLKNILQVLNYSAMDFKNNGLSLKDVLSYADKYLTPRYYTELIQAGYTAGEFKQSGYAKLPELKTYFTLEQLAEVYSIEELNKVYSIIELSKKFTLEQLIPLYSIKDLSTVFSLNDICTKFTLEQLVTVYPLDEIFATGKYKYDDIKKFNNGDNKTLNNLLKECKKNFMRKTNLECSYDPVKKIATNPTERYPK